jgi:3-oxoacyl-[acyl-carrier-protein] synthase-3
LHSRRVNQRPFPLRIAGLGAALPRTIVSSADIEARLGLRSGWIEATHGVRERRAADPALGETAPALGATAAREALEEAGIDHAEVDLVLNASGTPAQTIPDGGPLLQRALGLGDSGVPCFSVHATCLSFVVALDVAAQWLTLGRARNVLVVSSEVARCGLSDEDPDTASLFGDGAAAAVVTRPPEGSDSALERFLFQTWGEHADLAAIPGGGTLRHPNAPGSRPRDATFHMNGPALLRATMRHLPGFLDALLDGPDRHGLDLVVPHQASRHGLMVAERAGFPPDRIARTLETLGNVVAASIPLTLHAAARAGRVRRGDRVLLVGTGAGLSIGGALLRW